MIVFDLSCDEGHVFEAWFKNSETFEKQANASQIECPLCGGTDVRKSLMTPNIAAKGNNPSSHTQDQEHMEIDTSRSVAVSAHTPTTMEVNAEDVKRALDHMHDTMSKFRRQVEENCEYVGENFAEEVRDIHYGNAQERGIYGETTLEETQELLEEGIDILPVPGASKLDS